MKLLLTVSIILIATISLTQTYNNDLKNQRLEIKSLNADYLDLERTWIQNGIQFPALVHITQTVNEKKFEFQSYKNIIPERIESIKERLKTICPNLLFIDIQQNSVVASFGLNVLESEVVEFFRLVGYANYEVIE